MSKLSREKIRQLILQEFQKMEEDALRPMHDDPGRQSHVTSKHHSCHDCGHMMREKDSVCEQCGAMYEETDSLNEGDCGCGTCAECDENDYDVLNYDTDHNFIPDHMEEKDIEELILGAIADEFESHDDDDVMTPGEAFGTGVKIGNHQHYKGAYMAKKQMYKVSKYAEKLYHMIPDGHNLEDWMRTKLAQIADDISEVYHALDHDIYEGDI